jgi:hypothetical protein
MDLDLDEYGSILIQPITGYTLSLVGGTVVLMAIDFVKDPIELQTGAKSKRIQLAMDPEKALEFAETLKKTAKRARKRIFGFRS